MVSRPTERIGNVSAPITALRTVRIEQTTNLRRKIAEGIGLSRDQRRRSSRVSGLICGSGPGTTKLLRGAVLRRARLPSLTQGDSPVLVLVVLVLCTLIADKSDSASALAVIASPLSSTSRTFVFMTHLTDVYPIRGVSDSSAACDLVIGAADLCYSNILIWTLQRARNGEAGRYRSVLSFETMQWLSSSPCWRLDRTSPRRIALFVTLRWQSEDSAQKIRWGRSGWFRR